jgi:tetratricopeptide (TPR) repeat protein
MSQVAQFLFLSAFLAGTAILGQSPDALSDAMAMAKRAKAYDQSGQLREAGESYRQALFAIESAGDSQQVPRAQLLVALADVYMKDGLFARAERRLREAIQIYSGRVPADSVLLGVAKNELAQALYFQRNYDQALVLVDEALAIFAEQQEDREGNFAIALNNKGAIRWRQGERQEAVGLVKRSLALLEPLKGPSASALIYPLANLAAAARKTGKVEEAATLYARAVSIAASGLGLQHPVYAGMLLDYSECLRAAGRKSEAKSLQLRAQDILKENSLRTGSAFTVDASELAGR